ncbi:MAG: hypothetical protein CVU71_15170 [Deltaproteobacteria bacterium HGW-Deltaproteobacteria-6]|nr:MAG: hypothetical protein CVU71_15170 [Deltaproteobacteria bacterium HGW-Deltaproteobacteria-6]
MQKKNTPREGIAEGIEFQMCRLCRSGWNHFKIYFGLRLKIIRQAAVLFLLFDSAILSILRTLQKLFD